MARIHQDQSVEQLITMLKQQQETMNMLQELLTQHAKQQESMEKQFNDLVHIAKEGIEFVQQVQEGDTVQADFIMQSQQLIARTRQIIGAVHLLDAK